MIKISLFYFIVSFFIGTMIIYIIHPKPKVVIKYPSIENIYKTVYKDDNGTCYNYEKENTTC